MAESGSLVAELKRRKVGRVAIAYTGVALGVLEAADIIFAALFLSDSLYSMVVIVALAGFPVVLTLAWVFDLTSKGIQRTPAAAGPLQAEGLSSRLTRQLLVSGAIVLLAMTGVAWRYMPSDRIDLVAHRVAILPFENLTGDADLDLTGFIVADHLARALGEVESLEVIPPRRVQPVLERSCRSQSRTRRPALLCAGSRRAPTLGWW